MPETQTRSLESFQERPKPVEVRPDYLGLFEEWSQNQNDLIADREGSMDLSKNESYEMIRRNNEIQSTFMILYSSKKSPRERDLITKTIYAGLPSKELKASFAESGFVDGIVAELYVYEKLAEIPGVKARFSTTEEDTKDKFDIALELNSGRSIFIDAKSTMPFEAKRIKQYHANFGVKVNATRSGDDVLVVCPNPPSQDGIKFLGELKLGDGKTIASFEENERRDPNILKDLFIACYKQYAELRSGEGLIDLSLANPFQDKGGLPGLPGIR